MYSQSDIEEILLVKELNEKKQRHAFSIASMMKRKRESIMQNKQKDFDLYRINAKTGEKESIPVLK